MPSAQLQTVCPLGKLPIAQIRFSRTDQRASSSSQVYDETTAALRTRIEHSHGPEASELSGEAGKTVENIGGVAKDVLLATSVVVVGGIAADGVRRGATAEQEE